MDVFEFTTPNEENRYCLFNEDFENNPLILFHITPARNIDSIMKNGFKFGPNLQSVSYANNSSSCLAYRGNNVKEDYAVFMVEFDSLDGIKINSSDIHVYKKNLQPKIKGYCIVPMDYDFK